MILVSGKLVRLGVEGRKTYSNNKICTEVMTSWLKNGASRKDIYETEDSRRSPGMETPSVK